MSLYARSKPYQVLAPKTYQCDRCGIIRQHSRGSNYCRDCKPYAKETT